MALFIVNGNGNFFEFDSSMKVSLETGLLYGCNIFTDEDQMIEHVCDVTGEDDEDLRGGQIVIKLRDDEVIAVDVRGIVEYVTESVESFIVDYVV